MLSKIANASITAASGTGFMTGGGFGGCVIALVPETAIDAVTTEISAAVRAAGFDKPTVVRATASSGAGRVRPGE